MGKDMGAYLYSSFFFSLVGMGYFMYGKKQSDFIALLTGITLMVYPYFVTNVPTMFLIGVILLILPFALRRVFDL